MTDIFEEVDESLRQDTLLKWWRRALPYAIVGIVVVIASVGVYEFLKWRHSEEVARQAQVFDTGLMALDKKDFPGAKTAFSQLAAGNGAFAAVANHMLAGIEKDLTNDPAKIQTYLAAAAEKDKGLMGDLALMKLAYAKADTGNLAEIETTVAPLIAKGGSVGALARELVAAKALASGEIERARTEYQALSFEIDAPQSMKLRVQQTLLTFPPKPAAAAPATSPPAPATPASAAPAQPPAQPGQ